MPIEVKKQLFGRKTQKKHLLKNRIYSECQNSSEKTCLLYFIHLMCSLYFFCLPQSNHIFFSIYFPALQSKFFPTWSAKSVHCGAKKMGYNNPAFVDDDNKTSNSPIRLEEKRKTTPAVIKTTATELCTNDVMHETTVNKNSCKREKKLRLLLIALSSFFSLLFCTLVNINCLFIRCFYCLLSSWIGRIYAIF